MMVIISPFKTTPLLRPLRGKERGNDLPALFVVLLVKRRNGRKTALVGGSGVGVSEPTEDHL